MTNEEIIELAHLSLSVDRSLQDSASQEQLDNRKPPQGADLLLVTLARKILAERESPTNDTPGGSR